MEKLKALFISYLKMPDQLASLAFDAPGWDATFIDGLKEDGIPDDVSVFDWIVLINNDQDERGNHLYDHVCQQSLKQNAGFLSVSPLCAGDDDILKNFWLALAQCMYSAYFAPESIPAARIDIYQHFFFKGHLHFQKPGFAKMAALMLANLSLDPDRINLGLWEMFINGIEHGNLGITHEEKRAFVNHNNMDELVQSRLNLDENKDKFVNVIFSISTTQASFDIFDEGKGFDWQNFLEIDHARLFDKNGRGIALARLAGFDHLTYIGSGNHVQCKILF